MTEDFERIPAMDKMYLYEMEKKMEEEYWQWCEEQERLPANIVLIKTDINETKLKPSSF